MTSVDDVNDFAAVKAAVGDLLGDYASSAYVGRHEHPSDTEIDYYCYRCGKLIKGAAVIVEIEGHEWSKGGAMCWAFVCNRCLGDQAQQPSTLESESG